MLPGRRRTPGHGAVAADLELDPLPVQLARQRPLVVLPLGGRPLLGAIGQVLRRGPHVHASRDGR